MREGSVQFAQTRRTRRGSLAQRSVRSFRDARCVARAWRRVAQRSSCVRVFGEDGSVASKLHPHALGKGLL